MKPIRPDEVVEHKKKVFPPEVIAAFNDQIALNFVNGQAKVMKEDVISEIERWLGLSRKEILDRKLLDVEDLYRAEGWRVSWHAPDYTETFPAYFIFKRKSS